MVDAQGALAVVTQASGKSVSVSFPHGVSANQVVRLRLTFDLTGATDANFGVGKYINTSNWSRVSCAPSSFSLSYTPAPEVIAAASGSHGVVSALRGLASGAEALIFAPAYAQDTSSGQTSLPTFQSC